MRALVLFQLGWGFHTDRLFPGGDKVYAYQVHSAAGLPLLILARSAGRGPSTGEPVQLPGSHIGFPTPPADFTREFLQALAPRPKS